MDGIVIIDKPKGYTSREIVDIVGKNYKTRKVGHTGTLDPLATGVLVICIGKATKIVELITSYDKEYIATFKFGVLTDSLDSEGNIINDNKIILGGCVIYEDSPKYYCRFCNHYFNEDMEDVDERETEQSN